MTTRLIGRARLLLVVLAGALLATVVPVASAPPASAVTGSDFRAGNIIADSVFFNEDTMSAANIQSFLESKVPTCRGGTCLRDYYQDTWTRAADAQCAAYAGVPGERASTIIYKTAQACGINPMVLLVLIQKESSLVTSTAPSASAYRAATGYGCPDTAPCDAQYYGFYNQVYKAAWQYKRYTNNPTSYSYQAGRNNYVQWSPNASCGGSTVYIQNKATAALYIYTPYQPNAAALNNLYGTGDSCSAYGNRNFWRIFSDWFGSTQVSYAVVGPISGAYDALGGGTGVLGDAVGDQYPTVWGGLGQAFENGRIHYHPATGAHAVIGAIGDEYDSIGGEAGTLGYPVSDRYPTAGGGFTQAFQYGRIHWSPSTGAHAVTAEISTAYHGGGGAGGVLGYPLSDRYPTAGGGFTQPFQNGRIHFSPATGAHVVRAPLSAAYDALSGESGVLGYPTGEQYPTARGGTTQSFQNGRIHYSPTTGAHAVVAPLSTEYDSLSGEAGVLGYPTGDRYPTTGGGWAQSFQNGRIHSSTAGTFAVLGALSTAYDARSGEAGPFGYPSGDQYATTAGGIAQGFQGGSLVIPSGGQVIEVTGPVNVAYATLGGAAGTLGEPLAAATAVSGGTVQQFAGGRVYDGPDTDAVAVTAPVQAAYLARGGPGGSLGWPVSPATPGSSGAVVQRFTGGYLVVTSGGSAWVVASSVAPTWLANGGSTGALGNPTADQTAQAGGPQQTFDGGVVVTTSLSGSQAVVGPIATVYLGLGGPTGTLGAPWGPRYSTPRNGWTQAFQYGRVHYSPTTGAFAVLAPISASYDSVNGESGVLGYPVSNRYATPGNGWTQAFQNGRIHYSPATGAYVVLAPISAAYDSVNGESGPLGYPVSNRYATPGGGWTQPFQNGRIHYSPATGAHAVLAPISGAYDSVNGESGPLGYPTGDRYSTPGGGYGQAFQRGRITWAPGTGAQISYS